MPRRVPALTTARAAALRPLLVALDARLDRAARIAADPVELPRRYADPLDQEVAALFAAALAYGRADVFKPLLARVLDGMGRSPAAFVRAFARDPDPGVFAFAVYRFNRPSDVAALAAADRAGCGTSCPTRRGPARRSAGTCTSAGWCAGPTRWTSAPGATSSPPRRSSSRSTPTSTASRAASGSPAGTTRAGARPRRSRRRCGAWTPRTRCAST